MASKSFNSRYGQLFLLVSLILVVGLIFYSMSSFIGSFLGAVILYVLFRPVMRKIYNQRRWNINLVAILVCLLTFLLIMTPILLSSFMIIPKISIMFSENSVLMTFLSDLDRQVSAITGYPLITPDTFQNLSAKAGAFITDFLGESLMMLTEIALMYLFLFYFLINVGKMETFLENYLPFSHQRIKVFSRELEVQTFSNALGAPLLALLQALFAMFGYWIFGLPEPVFWGFMTGLFSFLPMIGSTLIWLPAALFQISTGSIWQGVAILLYGSLVISVVDNVFRFVFQKKFADVHPLVTIVGVIVGLNLFGIPGIIFGPLLISYFMILLTLFREEFMQESTGEDESV